MSFGWTIQTLSIDESSFIELRGLDVKRLGEPAIREELNRLWLEHGVIVFRGIPDPAAHVALSKVFGAPRHHPVPQSNMDPAHPELLNVQYSPGSENCTVVRVNGEERGGWLPLHFDLVYVDEVNHGGLLRPVQIPESGGATLFLDKIRLYDDLPDHLRSRVQGLEVLYSFKISTARMKHCADEVEMLRMGRKFQDIEAGEVNYPRSIHPLVYPQAGTNRLMLNLSPWFADAIVAMENDEGEELLRELSLFVQSSPHIYTHRWQPGDMVLWDNWRVLHAAEGVPPHCTRWMQRTTITGDYSLGRIEGGRTAVHETKLVDV